VLRPAWKPASVIAGRTLSQSVLFICSTPINFSPAVSRGFFFAAISTSESVRLLVAKP
jgi:hypothetical protein